MRVLLSTAMYYPEEDEGVKVLNNLYDDIKKVNDIKVIYLALALRQKDAEIIIIDKSQNIAIRYYKFILALFDNVKNGDLIINNFSFFTGFCIYILGLIKNVKIINLLSEDEIAQRVKSKSIKDSESFFLKEKLLSLCLGVFLQKSDLILAHDEGMKDLLIHKYKISSNKIQIYLLDIKLLWHPYEQVSNIDQQVRVGKKPVSDYVVNIINNKNMI